VNIEEQLILVRKYNYNTGDHVNLKVLFILSLIAIVLTMIVVPSKLELLAGQEEVVVKPGEEAVIHISTGRIFGVPLATIVGYLMGIIILITIITIAIYEYTLWRRARRIAKLVKPVK